MTTPTTPEPHVEPTKPSLTVVTPGEPGRSPDPLRLDLIGLRPEEHVEAERLQNALAERMFGVSDDPPRIDRFIILGRLGAGGMGVVYSAYDPHLDRRVALKLLRDRGRVRRVEHERLLREAHALARITHPNVVTVHEVGQLGGQVFVVMEFVVGQTLDVWARAAARSWREVLEVYGQAGRGLAAAHAAGLVHRDFKPQNAIIGDDGRVRVVDFGLARGEHVPSNDDALAAGSHVELGALPVARFDASLTRPDALIGTPAYMSPEQYVHRTVGPASDQFSFCVALHEALVGARPFHGDTPIELATQILEGAVREPPRGTRVPAWILTTLRRGLSVSPRERYASMDELLAALARDPARARRRWLVGAAFAALAGSSVAMFVQQQPAPALPCQGSAEALAEVWGATQRTSLRERFVELPTPHAEVVGSRILGTLDAYATRWQDMHQDACLAHHRGEQSGVLLDKRMACLQRRRAALGSAVDVLGTADVQTFENAAFMVHDLPPVHMCGDLDVLEAELPVPEDPAVAREVAAAREDLARAATYANAGRLEEAHGHAHRVEARARTLNYRPLVAEALLVRGRIEMEHDGGDASRPSVTLLEAFLEGMAASSDAVAAEALVRRLYIEAVRPDGRTLREEEDYGLVRALLERMPEPHRVRGLFLNNAGTIAAARGDFEAARNYLRQALEVKQGALEINPIEVLETRFNLALMAGDETAQLVGFELAVEGFERELGPTHIRTFMAKVVLAHAMKDPLVAQQRFADLCDTYEHSYPEQLDGITSCRLDQATRAADLGDRERAAELFERVAHMLDAPVMPPSVRLRHALAHAYALHHRGRSTEAATELGATLADLERAELPRWLTTPLAEVRVALGQTLVASGRPIEAVAALQQAIEALARASEHRVDHAVRRALARARLTLVRAVVDARALGPSSSFLGPGQAGPSDSTTAEVLDAAEAWYRNGGVGYAWRLDEIQALRERLLAP